VPSRLALPLVLCCASLALAELLVTDRYRDSVHRFSSVDGSLVQLDFIVGAGPGQALDSPMEALVVGDRIWLSDQNLDSVFRYTLTGQYVDRFVGPAHQIDNIRGFDIVQGVLYLTNFGTANGAPGPAIRRFDVATGANLGTLTMPGSRSPWDVLAYGARLLVSDDTNISTNPLLDTAVIWDIAQNPVGVFASGSAGTNGLSLPKQMIALSNGRLLVANNGTPRALLELNAAGQIVASYPLGTLRPNGLYELENGRIFIAGEDTGVLGTNGVYTLDRATGTLTPILLGNQVPGGLLPHYVNYYAPPPAVCPGDLNCDGAVDFDDLDRLVEAFNYPGGVGWPHPNCPWLSGDCNADGQVTFDDIDPFVARIGSSCP